MNNKTRPLYVIRRVTKEQFFKSHNGLKGGNWVDQFKYARVYTRRDYAEQSLKRIRKYEPSSYVVSCTLELHD